MKLIFKLLCIGVYCFAAEVKASEYLIDLNSLQNLSPAQQQNYIKTVSEQIQKLELKSKRSYANNQKPYFLKFLIEVAEALPSYMNPNCMFAGNISFINEVKEDGFGVRYMCNEPKSKDCTSEQVPCNALLFGKGICIDKKDYKRATAICNEKSKPIQDIIKDIDPDQWRVFQYQIKKYCQYEEKNTKPTHKVDEHPCKLLKTKVDEIEKEMQKRVNANTLRCQSCEVELMLYRPMASHHWQSVSSPIKRSNACKIIKEGTGLKVVIAPNREDIFADQPVRPLSEHFFTNIVGGPQPDWSFKADAVVRRPFNHENSKGYTHTVESKNGYSWAVNPHSCKIGLSLKVNSAEVSDPRHSGDADYSRAYLSQLMKAYDFKEGFYRTHGEQLEIVPANAEQINLYNAISYATNSRYCKKRIGGQSIIVSGSSEPPSSFEILEKLQESHLPNFVDVDLSKKFWIHTVDRFGTGHAQEFDAKSVEDKSPHGWFLKISSLQSQWCVESKGEIENPSNQKSTN